MARCLGWGVCFLIFVCRGVCGNEFLTLNMSSANNISSIHQALRDHYTRRLELNNHSRGTVQFICKDFCGGLGDRVKGAAISLLVAMLTDRVFLPVNWNFPVQFQMFFDEGLDYIYTASDFHQALNVQQLNIMDDHTLAGSVQFDTSADSWHIRANVFQEALSFLLENPSLKPLDGKYMELLHGLTANQILACILPFIYKSPTPLLQSEFESTWREWGAGMVRVGVHVRTGVAPWLDPRRVQNIDVLSKWTEEIAFQCDRFRNLESDQRCLVFVMSDNVDVIESIVNVCRSTLLLTAVKLDGPILHIDRSPWNKDHDNLQLFNTYKRLFMEFLMLHYMDVIIAVQSGLSQVPYIRMDIPAVIMKEEDGTQTFVSAST